jgi:hypothetical protein
VLSRTSIFLRVITCSPHRQDQVKQELSAMKLCFTCSTRVRGTHCKKSRPRNCESTAISHLFAITPLDTCHVVVCSGCTWYLRQNDRWNRNWRYHKDLRIWITKESGSAPSTKIPGGEAGAYTWWDPESWGKDRKEMTVRYTDLEEKTVPAFSMVPGLVLNQAQGAQGQQVPGAIGGQLSSQTTGQPRMQMAGI